MYGISIPTFGFNLVVNVSEYSIHGSYGYASQVFASISTRWMLEFEVKGRTGFQVGHRYLVGWYVEKQWITAFFWGGGKLIMFTRCNALADSPKPTWQRVGLMIPFLGPRLRQGKDQFMGWITVRYPHQSQRKQTCGLSLAIGAPAHEGIDSPWQSGHDSIVFFGHDQFLIAGFNNPSEK